MTAAAPSDGALAHEAALQALFAAVRAAPYEHDFFALLRRVEGLQPQAPRIGRAPRPSQEVLRLGQEPELQFGPAAVASFDPEEGAAPRLGVRFFGLLGPQGPMPLHLTEHVRDRLRLRADPTSARFLDVFHHRLLCLFYRAWADAQPAVQQDRPRADRFAVWLGATFGLDPQAWSQGSLPVNARLFQAGLLGARSRHPEGLAKLVSQHFDVPVRIEPYTAHWLSIAPADRSRLGFAGNRPERAGARGAILGATASVGSKVLDRQYKFRIALGPVSLARYRAFLPDGSAWPRLRDWVVQYVGLDLRWDVQLCLAADELPEPRLGRPMVLGVSAWLAGRDRRRDRADLRLRPGLSFLLRHGVSHA
jgi:type VI secretion system protein ImpH